MAERLSVCHWTSGKSSLGLARVSKHLVAEFGVIVSDDRAGVTADGNAASWTVVVTAKTEKGPDVADCNWRPALSMSDKAVSSSRSLRRAKSGAVAARQSGQSTIT